MTATPTLYLKQDCPFCLKVRIALLETGQQDAVTVRDFAAGTPEEQEIRAALSHLQKVSFPTAETEPGRFLTESDEIVAWIGQRAGIDATQGTVYRNYAQGVFKMAMSLWKENAELKKAAAAGKA